MSQDKSDTPPNTQELRSVKIDDALFEQFYSIFQEIVQNTHQDVKTLIEKELHQHLEKKIQDIDYNYMSKAFNQMRSFLKGKSNSSKEVIIDILKVDEPEILLQIIKSKLPPISSETPFGQHIRALRDLNLHEFSELQQYILDFNSNMGHFDEIPNAKETADQLIQSIILKNQINKIHHHLNHILIKNNEDIQFLYNIIILQNKKLSRDLKNQFQGIQGTLTQKKQKKVQILMSTFQGMMNSLTPETIEQLFSKSVIEIPIKKKNKIQKYLQEWVTIQHEIASHPTLQTNQKNYEYLLNQIHQLNLSDLQRQILELKKRFLKMNAKTYQSELFSKFDSELLQDLDEKKPALEFEKIEEPFPDIHEKDLTLFYGQLNKLGLYRFSESKEYKAQMQEAIDAWNREKHQYQWRADLHQIFLYASIVKFVNQYCPFLNFLIIENYIQKVEQIIKVLGIQSTINPSLPQGPMS